MTPSEDQHDPAPPIAVDADTPFDYSGTAHYTSGAVPAAEENGGLWSQHMFQWLASEPPAAEDPGVQAVDDAAPASDDGIAIAGQSTTDGQSISGGESA